MRFSRKSYDWRISMKNLIKAVNDLPLIVKIILALPGLDIVWNIMRLIRSLDANNMVGIVLAVVILFVGIPFFWIIDILCLVLKKDIWWID